MRTPGWSGPEIGEVASLTAVQDREDLACGDVFGPECWDAVDLLEREQGWGIHGEVDLDGLIVEGRQESREGDVVPDELDGPSLRSERGGERSGEWAYVAGWVAGLGSDERVQVAGQPVHDA